MAGGGGLTGASSERRNNPIDKLAQTTSSGRGTRRKNASFCVVFSVHIRGGRSSRSHTSTSAMYLLVREAVSSVEQLLTRQAVVRDIAGLPADQVVRHGVRSTAG